jgi:hypothetical protein
MAGTIASLRILEGRQGIVIREQRTEIREQGLDGCGAGLLLGAVE